MAVSLWKTIPQESYQVTIDIRARDDGHLMNDTIARRPRPGRVFRLNLRESRASVAQNSPGYSSAHGRPREKYAIESINTPEPDVAAPLPQPPSSHLDKPPFGRSPPRLPHRRSHAVPRAQDERETRQPEGVHQGVLLGECAIEVLNTDRTLIPIWTSSPPPLLESRSRTSA